MAASKTSIVKGSVVDTQKLETLNQDFKALVNQLILNLTNKGYHLRVVWGVRTKDENDALAKKGFASKSSKHLTGRAVDIIDRRYAYKDTVENRKYWKDLSVEAAKLGLIWGGTFKKRFDPCHIEAPPLKLLPDHIQSIK